MGFVSTSLVSDVQILRLLWQYCQQRFNLVFGWIMSPTREAGLPPSPRVAAYFACEESSRFSTVIGLYRTFEETSGRHCRVGRLICQ